MFFFTAIRRFVLVLTVLFCVVWPVFDLVAQEIDDDPLMLDGEDEFGFGQFESLLGSPSRFWAVHIGSGQLKRKFANQGRRVSLSRFFVFLVLR